MKTLKITKKDSDYYTYCTYCHCMTHSIRKGRAKVICDICGKNKTLCDYYQYELNEDD